MSGPAKRILRFTRNVTSTPDATRFASAVMSSNSPESLSELTSCVTVTGSYGLPAFVWHLLATSEVSPPNPSSALTLTSVTSAAKATDPETTRTAMSFFICDVYFTKFRASAGK